MKNSKVYYVMVEYVNPKDGLISPATYSVVAESVDEAVAKTNKELEGNEVNAEIVSVQQQFGLIPIFD